VIVHDPTANLLGVTEKDSRYIVQKSSVPYTLQSAYLQSAPSSVRSIYATSSASVMPSDKS
jgi:hypothetical protein